MQLDEMRQNDTLKLNAYVAVRIQETHLPRVNI